MEQGTVGRQTSGGSVGRGLLVVVLVLLLVGGAIFLFGSSRTSKTQSNSDAATNQSESEASEPFILVPQDRPEHPIAGQLYFDKTAKLLNYYDGSAFVPLGGAHVASITSDSSSLVVTKDDEGNVTLTNTGGGTTTTNGQSLSLPLSIANGGTGIATVPVNGVVLGNGTSALTTVTASGAGLCLVSTAGAPVFAACPGGSGGFANGGNSFGAAATLGTNDANDLAFETNNNTVETLSGANGSATFQNIADSTTGFRVLTAGATPVFVVDTSTPRVYVGNPTGDTTGALLILDAKTTSGDPTGMAGAMYYNGNIGQFRCYEVDYWRDCVQSVRTSFHYTNDMVGNASDSYADFVTDNGLFGTVQSETGHPGIVSLNTLTGNTGTFVWLVPRSSAAEVVRFGGGDTWRAESVLRVPTSPGLSTGGERFSVRSGFVDNATSSDSGNGVNGCFFRYRDDLNGGRWQGVCRDNTTESTCDTTITVAAGTWYRLTVVVNAAGTSADYRINGTSRCQVAANIPTALGRETNWGVALYKDVGTTNRVVDLDYFDVEGQLGVAR